MIQISEQSARAIIRLLDDIINIETRSRCSDTFFRSHFIDLVKAGNATGTWSELREAVKNGENKPPGASDVEFTTPDRKPVRMANKRK